jgi:hypothetical protein
MHVGHPLPPAASGQPDRPADVSEPSEEPVLEALVADDRAGLSPAQQVERKLLYLLGAQPLPVSHAVAGRRILGHR